MDVAVVGFVSLNQPFSSVLLLSPQENLPNAASTTPSKHQSMQPWTMLPENRVRTSYVYVAFDIPLVVGFHPSADPADCCAT